MAKRKKNKRGRDPVAEENQANPAVGEATPSLSDEEIADPAWEGAGGEEPRLAEEAAAQTGTAAPAPMANASAEGTPADEFAGEGEAPGEDVGQEAPAGAASGEGEPSAEASCEDTSEGSADQGEEGDEGEGVVRELADEDVVTRRVTRGSDSDDPDETSGDPAPGEPVEEDVWGDEAPTNPAVLESRTADEDAKVWEGAGETGEASPSEGEADEGERPLDIPQMQSIIESLLFASDRALNMGDFKRLLDERDGKKIQAALDELIERRRESGIQVVHLSNGWHLRTNHENGAWVAKLLAGKPMRLSRAMMETLAIVAYRQPVTRPEIDDIRGVDCGPVLKTLLDRGLIRIIGKKEDVGRPMLYGTTPEFLRVFNLRDLSDLPTLREFYELSEDQQAHVEAKHGPAPEAAPAEGETADASVPAGTPTSKKEPPKLSFVSRQDLPPEDEDADPLLEELEDATKAATQALGAPTEPTPEEAPAPEGEAKNETPEQTSDES